MLAADDADRLLSRPDSDAGRLQRAVLRLLDEREEEVRRTNIRFLYYELVMGGVISKEVPKRTDGKKGRRTDQNLIDAVTHLRERGIIPWEQIVDETRHYTGWHRSRTVAGYLIDAVDRARIDPWRGKPPVILTESRSLSGVLIDEAQRYLVDITSTNGQSRGHLHNEVAPELWQGRHVISLGDFDLAGGHIDQNNRRVLERLVGELDWHRLAITETQANRLVAAGMPMVTKTDRRFNPARTYQAMETEALGQREIVSIVREHLDGLLPEPLEAIREREQRQRRQMAEFLANFDAA